MSEGSAEGELTVSSRAGDVATAGQLALLPVPEGSIETDQHGLSGPTQSIIKQRKHAGQGSLFARHASICLMMATAAA